MPSQEWQSIAAAMVYEQIVARGVRDQRVVEAMQRIPRHKFLSPDVGISDAYADSAIDIGFGQTTSQPFVVAAAVEALCVGPSSRVLEIGAGSGYQTAVLSLLAQEVFSLDVVPEFVERAGQVLGFLSLGNVHLAVRNGVDGWEENAPFDCILVSAVSNRVPEALLNQLAPGGRLVMPIGSQFEAALTVISRLESGEVCQSPFLPVRFVQLQQ